MSFAQEQSNRKTLEMKFLKLTDEIRMHIASFRESVQDTRKQLGECKNEVLAVKKDTQTEVVSLTTRMHRELLNVYGTCTARVMHIHASIVIYVIYAMSLRYEGEAVTGP